MGKFRDVITLCLVLQSFHTESARILAIYPVPSFSHQVVFRPITLELLKRGHEVVVITTDPMYPKGQAPKNLTEIDVHDISYESWAELQATSRGNKGDLISQLQAGVRVILKTVEKQFYVPEIKELIKGKGKFDLLLTEACVRLVLVFAHVYNIPVIQISSFGAIFGNYDTIGAPQHPFLYQQSMNQRLYNLTNYEKLYELYNNYMSYKFLRDMEGDENSLLRQHFGPKVPGVKQLLNKVDMLFLNVHPIWEGNRPVPPSVVHMGGLPQKDDKELPAHLKSYLDSSKNGVIYISFGTNVKPSLLPAEKIQMLVRAVSKMPYDVLWKWDKDELPGRSANIRLSKWLPQSDLLKHPNVKLFVTQGGLQSTDEAITAGVPLVGVPMLGDQWYNVEKYVHHGIGVKLQLETLSEEAFSNAVKTVMENESYRKNIIRLRTLMEDQPQPPLERAIWWIEYVIRHKGARHLRAPAANISWSEYLELELLAIVLSTISLASLVVIGLVYSLCSFVSNNFVIKAKIKSS